MQAAKEHSEQLGVDGLMLASNYLSNSNLMRAFTFYWDLSELQVISLADSGMPFSNFACFSQNATHLSFLYMHSE